jgi:hypothetical protein
MGKYFNLMKQHLELKNYSPHTVTNYLTHMKNFIKFHMKDPSPPYFNYNWDSTTVEYSSTCRILLHTRFF